jgi:hypothetical protein
LPLQYEFPTLEAVRELRIAVVKSTMKQILRWLAVLPGALLAGVIVTFPVHWAALYIHDFGAGEPIITNEEGKGLLLCRLNRSRGSATPCLSPGLL